MVFKDRCYLLRRFGGASEILWCHPAQIDTLKDYMNVVVVGEGSTRQEAIRDAHSH